jgi:hypothetical protein
MNEAARRALDEHWQIELAASPEARAMFDKLLALQRSREMTRVCSREEVHHRG